MIIWIPLPNPPTDNPQGVVTFGLGGRSHRGGGKTGVVKIDACCIPGRGLHKMSAGSKPNYSDIIYLLF